MSQALANKEELTDKNTQKLSKYMLKIPYFQDSLISAVSSGPDSGWFANLSRKSQLKVLKIITSVSPSDLDRPKVQKRIVRKLIRDEEIGTALVEQYGEDFSSGDFLSQLSGQIAQGSSVTHHTMLLA